MIFLSNIYLTEPKATQIPLRVNDRQVQFGCNSFCKFYTTLAMLIDLPNASHSCQQEYLQYRQSTTIQLCYTVEPMKLTYTRELNSSKQTTIPAHDATSINHGYIKTKHLSRSMIKKIKSTKL